MKYKEHRVDIKTHAFEKDLKTQGCPQNDAKIIW